MQPVAMPRPGMLPREGEKPALRRNGRRQGIAVSGHKSETLLQRLKFFPGLKAHRFAGRNGNLGASARIAANASLTGTHVEDAEAAKPDTFASGEGRASYFR